jgi:hypothetical protein
MNKIDATRSWLISIIANKIVLILNIEGSRFRENFNKKMLIIVNTTEYMKNNSSFEIPKTRLYFGMQNMSKLEASIITRMLDRQTKNSNALDLNNLKPPCSFLLVSITQTHGLALKETKTKIDIGIFNIRSIF